jgi:hypothetical protein
VTWWDTIAVAPPADITVTVGVDITVPTEPSWDQFIESEASNELREVTSTAVALAVPIKPKSIARIMIFFMSYPLFFQKG